VTEFPELQQALVHAAGRRRRAPRLARPLIVAVACAAIAAAALTITRAPKDDERAAAPPADPLAAYTIFQQPATDADEPPSAVTSMPGLRIDQARLAESNGPWRLYLVAGALDGRETLCAFAVVGERARFGCDPAGAVHGYAFAWKDGDPGGVVAVVPDGIDLVAIGFPGRSALQAPVRHNTVLAWLKPWPEGAGTIAWTDAAGTRHDEPLKSGPAPGAG
jgi:hypothetical protein